MMRRAAAAVLTGAIVLAACGSGDDDSASGDSASGGVGDMAAVELPTPEPGPIPDLPVNPESAASPLPEVTVRRINGEGGWVQLKNELPAEQALLVWFWAPH